MIVLVERGVLGHHFGGGKDAAIPTPEGSLASPSLKLLVLPLGRGPGFGLVERESSWHLLTSSPGSDDLSLTP